MIRHCWLLVLCGCAASSSSPSHPEGPLDRLIGTTNAYTSFHLKAEIHDGKEAVPLEMAFKAPDRALVRYGNRATTILAAGKVHHYLRGTYYVLDAAAALGELKQRYPGLGIGRAPEPVFTLGDGIRADVVVGRLGARLGWLEELRLYKAEGNVYRRPQIEIVLREDGFVERSALPAGSFALKSVTIGAEVPDSLFALPPTDGLQDLAPRLQAAKVDELEDSYRRWILETSTADATLEALVRIELIRKYEPEKMTELLSTSLQKSLAAFRALHPDAKPDFLKEKIAIDRGRSMGSVEIMEDEIQKAFEKELDSYFRGMANPPPQKEMLDISRRWQAAVKRQVDEQIRMRFTAVFDAAEKN
jgi:hypothetical protein